MEIVLTTDGIIKAAALIAALIAIGTIAVNIIKWMQKQEKQSVDILSLQAEQCLLTEGILACLKGLKEQGCNGPVTEAINKIEMHLNNKAHGKDDAA